MSFAHRKARINPFGAGRSTNTLGKSSTEVFGLLATLNQENPLGYVVEPFDGVDTQQIFPAEEMLVVSLFPFGVNGPSPFTS